MTNGVALVIQIAATTILSRLLTPEDFGIVTMVTTFSLLLSNWGSNGFTETIVQREHLTHRLASNLFWINLGVGLLLTIGFAASGSLLAWIYDNPNVQYITVGMSLTIFPMSLGVIHTALIRRAMWFTAYAGNDMTARAVSLIVTIVCGLAGWGADALIAGGIAYPVSKTIACWSLCRWVPGLPQRVPGTGDMVRFACNVYGRFSVNYFSRNTDNFLIGLRFDAQPLGFYKKAYDLFALSATQLIAPLTAVAVSALSRLHRDPVQYSRYLLGAISVVTFGGMALGANLTLVGPDVIRVLLGPGWEPSGAIFSFFGPGIGVMLLYGTHSWIHLSIGTPERWFRWGLVEFAVTTALFLIALPWGPSGIAVAWTASFWILVIPSLWYAGKPIGFPITLIISVVWRYVVASVLAGGASALILLGFPGFREAPGLTAALVRISATSILFGLLYLSAVILLHRGLGPIHQVTSLLRELLPKRGSPEPASARQAKSGQLLTLASETKVKQ
jgi:PST family polysaccharide transporter